MTGLTFRIATFDQSKLLQCASCSCASYDLELCRIVMLTVNLSMKFKKAKVCLKRVSWDDRNLIGYPILNMILLWHAFKLAVHNYIYYYLKVLYCVPPTETL